MHYYEYHQKSPENLEKSKEKYPWLFDMNFSDESREVRYHLLEYLYLEYWYSWMLEKDDLWKPLPIQYNWSSLYWSLSHSTNYLAFIVSDSPTGIDIVEKKERDAFIQDIHSPHEYDILGGKNWDNFYILWSAKESIIKVAGSWLDDIKDIQLMEIHTESISLFAFKGETYRIQTMQLDPVIISYTS